MPGYSVKLFTWFGMFLQYFGNVNLRKSSRLLAVLGHKTVNFNNPNKPLYNAGAISFLNSQHFFEFIIKKIV